MSLIEETLNRLGKSKFRSHFKLSRKDADYLERLGLKIIKDHAWDIIKQRLAPACIPNDGKQTPLRNHPVFTAQHATGTCCRKCLQKWHNIIPGKELSNSEIELIVELVSGWLQRQPANQHKEDKQQTLF